jgi:hypothetical protein
MLRICRHRFVSVCGQALIATFFYFDAFSLIYRNRFQLEHDFLEAYSRHMIVLKIICCRTLLRRKWMIFVRNGNLNR